MGMLLRFSPKPNRSASRSIATGAPMGKVLLFTGIRYERGKAPATATPESTARRRRKG
ncbi:hypothetical protein [Pelagibacterium lentulum]|uniref:Uncharacterized protein n=1 Tax=Pelagibacterium lentulum TaxID=2029865 RepID=A0A916RHN3_9HYPH|nr:hypothetical protein [Pelagibacterium lentulum]GGA54642.1 hypothetical protein GCM10011499_26020 [Pelagibacterium lentulum]